jgi:hypothetical protein
MSNHLFHLGKSKHNLASVSTRRACGPAATAQIFPLRKTPFPFPLGLEGLDFRLGLSDFDS